MSLTIAIIAPGEMGSAIARSSLGSDTTVLTALGGRSEASQERARAAGFQVVGSDDELVARSQFLLSVVPPAAAVSVAERFAPVLARAAHKPVYVDCNAIAPATATAIADILAPSGADFLDAVLFGGPTSLKPGVTIHVSGAGAERLLQLAGPELTIHTIDGPIGAASALKLCFAGINKGYIALGAAMFRAAIAAGCEKSLISQLAVSHGGILDYASRAIAPMLPKAHRWDAEMEEIAQFLSADAPMAEVFQSLASFYAEMGRSVAAGNDAELASLVQVLSDLRQARA